MTKTIWSRKNKHLSLLLNYISLTDLPQNFTAILFELKIKNNLSDELTKINTICNNFHHNFILQKHGQS